MFTDKIVVVGIAGLGSDLHQTVLGKVPGVILQANYIESLLSDRMFKPLPLSTPFLEENGKLHTGLPAPPRPQVRC